MTKINEIKRTGIDKNKFRFKEREKKTWPTIQEDSLDPLWGTLEKEREESTKTLAKIFYQKHMNEECMDFDLQWFEKCKLLIDQIKRKIMLGC